MKLLLPRLTGLVLLLAVALGCGRKEEKRARKADQRQKVEEVDAAEEGETESAALKTLAESDPDSAGAAGAPANDALLSGVSPELLATDKAYEAWFKRHKLDLSDAKMLDADGDSDGFSNRDEFLADSNPHDANSRPGIHKAIRLKEYNETKLPFVLEAVEGDKARIRRTDEGEGKSETVRSGQTVRGTTYKVERVASKMDTDKHGQPADRSQVVLSDPATKERITLVKDLPARSSASFALLTSEDGNTTRKVRQGETFPWPEGGPTYKVVDLREDQVVVQEVETGKMWTIPRQ